MLKTELCGINLRNPTVLASGILGITKPGFERMAREGAGAVTLKSLCHEERLGNPNPVMCAIPEGFLNAVALPGQGIDNATEDFKQLDDLSVPVIGSVYGYTIEQFAEVAEKMAKLKPAMIELDISCPHMKGYDKPFFADADSITQIVKLCKKSVKNIPISAKLGPAVHNFGELCSVAEKAGADAITAINTMPAMRINVDMGKPVLSNKIGGLSGQGLRPIAVRCVFEAYANTNIPIIGTGGASTGEHAIELIMAGATAVGIGTAVWERGPEVFKHVTDEMQAWMKEHKVKSLDDIRGCAHD